jgi:sugar O-acyltransferase (sialic acid O-acetyltransferase NeuD family)
MFETSPRRIVVLADGGFAKSVIGAAQVAGYVVEAVYDDDASRWGLSLLGVPIVGPLEQAPARGLPGVVSIIDTAVREAAVSRLPLEWATIVHPRAYLHPSVTVGAGTIIFAGALGQPGVRLGAHVIIGPNATVAHDCTVEDFAYLAPGVDLAGTVHVGRGAWLEAGAVVGPNRTIGAGTRIGPRAVVIRDLPEHVAAEGAPARVIRAVGGTP